jgi:putative transcriptional regulator
MKTVKSYLNRLVALKAARENRKLTLRTVAQETGISRYTIYALAADELKDFPGDVLVKLCEYFECELSDLLRIEESQP